MKQTRTWPADGPRARRERCNPRHLTAAKRMIIDRLNQMVCCKYRYLEVCAHSWRHEPYYFKLALQTLICEHKISKDWIGSTLPQGGYYSYSNIKQRNAAKGWAQ